MFRWLLLAIVCAGLGALGVFIAAGRSAPPLITIVKPDGPVGQQGTLEISANGTRGRLTNLTATLEAPGHTVPLLSLDAAAAAKLWQRDTDRLTITQAFGKQHVPALEQGAATIVVTATSKSWLNLRTLTSRASKEIQVRLEPPRLAVLSTRHYVNHGGAEMVVYRATPPDVESGVRVGAFEYRGFPAPGAAETKIAFFALLHDQPLSTPIVAFARDAAGNEVTARFVDSVFEKPIRRSRIEVDDKFFAHVVPEILEHSPELKVSAPDDRLAAFLKINGDLRRMNDDRIVSIADKTSSTRLWNGPFVQLGNSQVEATFADHRTYFHNGKEIDQQVHLGFDLAVTANVAVVAANAGTVLNASWLGIFGNCVIIDHGMGVASLYGHLSSFDVKVGDAVAKGQMIGRSGMTGLAGGDHLHFTMLVGGHPVNPVEWWDAHWVQDRVERKLQEIGINSSVAVPVTSPVSQRATARAHRKPATHRAGR